jgi:hypothetical protein
MLANCFGVGEQKEDCGWRPTISTVKYFAKTLMKCQKLQNQGTMIERERERERDSGRERKLGLSPSKE